MLLDEFGVTGRHRHIINGHVPVRSIKGENPNPGKRKLLVIDGGFSKAYHPETGIAGYTLVYHSRGFQLVQHEPFLSTDQAIKEGKDIRFDHHRRRTELPPPDGQGHRQGGGPATTDP